MQIPKFAIFASGDGSTFEEIIRSARRGWLSGKPVGLIVSSRNCGAVLRAKALNVECIAIETAAFESVEQWDSAVLYQLKIWNAEFIICAGFLKMIGPKVLDDYRDKILNTHPSLLPKYGGKGMFGSNVHKSVALNSEKQTGISVHIVTKDYDEGPLIAQKIVQLQGNESWQEIEAKVKSFEKDFYIETIIQFFQKITK
jgi:formyltetrahydrofolate-dependent phosphoribosylglycinamide formyltransferase